MGFRDFLSEFSEAFFPEGIKCIICDNELPIDCEDSLCDECRIDLPYNKKGFCRRCGRPTNAGFSICYDCKSSDVYFSKARSVFLYEDGIKNLIYNLKFGDGQYLAKYCAVFLYRLFQTEGMHPDLITYVPMHPKRLKKRGYNQAKLIADCLSQLVDIPIKKLLIKFKETKKMSSLSSKSDRKTNILDSFIFNKQWNEPDNADDNKCSFDSIAGKRILLIDDLFTTGSTVNECARILKSEKCCDVTILTFASQALKSSYKSRKKT